MSTLFNPIMHGLWNTSLWKGGFFSPADYAFFWALTSDLTETSGMVGTVTRKSGGSFIDPDGVLQIADGDETPFSHDSIEDETGYIGMQGSFVDGSAWFDGEALGSDIPRTWAAVVGTPGIAGDVITFAAELSYVSDEDYWDIGKTYKINVTVADYVGTGLLRLPYGDYPTRYEVSANGTYEYYHTTTNSDVFIFSEADTAATVIINSIQEVTASLADQADTANLLIVDDSTGAKGYGYCGEVGGGETLGTNLFDQDGGSGGAGDKGAFVLADLRLAELSSGSLTVGTMYEISAQSLLDFTADGAPDSVVGTTFVATGTSLTLTAADKVYPVDISWTPYSANMIEIDSGALHITWVDNNNGTYLRLRDITDLTTDLEIGKQYKITGTSKVGSGDSVELVILTDAGDNPYVTVDATTFSPFELYFTASSTNSEYLRAETDSGEEIWLANLQISEVTEPAATAIHIYKDYELTTGNEGYNALDTGLDYNAAAWEFDVYQNLMSSSGSTAQPRFEALGLLSEGEGTNYCLHSNGFDEWGGALPTEVQDAIGPDGVANSAWTVTDPGGNGAAVLTQLNIVAPIDGTYTYSIFIKKGTADNFTLRLYDATAVTSRLITDFLWAAGVPSMKGGESGGWVEQLGASDWWRVGITIPAVVGGNLHYLYLYPTEFSVDPGTPVTTIFYGAQFEPTPYATSYIPTTDIPVTRTADSHSWPMSTEFKNLMGNVADSPFTLIAEWTPKYSYGDVTETYRGIVHINTAEIGLFSDRDTGRFYSYDGATTAYVDPDYAADTTYIFVLRVYDDSGTMKFEVGEKHGGVWDWSLTPGLYDGSFNPTTNFLIGYLNQYPFNIKDIYFYDSAKDQSWIEGEF